MLSKIWGVIADLGEYVRRCLKGPVQKPRP